MKKKRLVRDTQWFFQHFPYFQTRVEEDFYHGLVGAIHIGRLDDGGSRFWELSKAGKTKVAGEGMVWLQLIPDNAHRVITAMFLPNKQVSLWYVDIIDSWGLDEDGVAFFIDKYLDVIFTPQKDVVVADRNELDDAYHSGELSDKQYQDALAEGDAILKDLCEDIGATEVWCRKILDYVEELIKKEKK